MHTYLWKLQVWMLQFWLKVFAYDANPSYLRLSRKKKMINLSKTIHLGIIKAQKDYIYWSGLGIGHSAEYLIVSNIAQSIATLKYINDIQSVYVEQSIEELANIDNLNNDDFRKGRCDICIEDDDGFAIIEVKNTLTNKGKTYDSILRDIERIRIFLENDNIIKDGYICFLNANFINDKEDIKKNRKEIKFQIDNRLQSFKEDIQIKFPNLKFIFTKKYFIEKTAEDMIWSWQSVVAKIQLK